MGYVVSELLISTITAHVQIFLGTLPQSTQLEQVCLYCSVMPRSRALILSVRAG